MKKLTLSIFATFFLLSFIPTQLKAGTGSNPIEATENSTTISSVANTDKVNEIKPIDTSVQNSSESEVALKESSPAKDVQDEHSSRYNNRHQHENADVVITSGYEGHHHHSGAYLGVGGILVIVLILVLIL